MQNLEEKLKKGSTYVKPHCKTIIANRFRMLQEQLLPFF